MLPVDWVSYSQTDYVYSDFLAEADTYHSFGPTAVEYGLYFRNTDGDNYYYFGISANGHFNFWKRIDAEWIEILPWAPSDALETGEGAYNRMGVLANGAQLTLLANDVMLAEVEDDSIAAGYGRLRPHLRRGGRRNSLRQCRGLGHQHTGGAEPPSPQPLTSPLLRRSRAAFSTSS